MRLPAPRPKLLADKTPLVCPSARVPPHSLAEQLPRAAVGSTRAVLSRCPGLARKSRHCRGTRDTSL